MTIIDHGGTRLGRARTAEAAHGEKSRCDRLRPAGISAAAQPQQGRSSRHVFERAIDPGLAHVRHSNMKLDKEEVVLRRIKQMEGEGIVFVGNTEVARRPARSRRTKRRTHGQDARATVIYPAEKLLKRIDAAFSRLARPSHAIYR